MALARALAVEPQILLLDEPFGALDAQVRKELRRWLRQLHEELKFTSVFVTHDQEEAMEVADRVVVMSQGSIEQVGTPDEVWRDPATRFVLEFLGEVNRFDGEVHGSQFHVGAHHWPLGYTSAHQGAVDLFLRPWEIDVSRKSSLETPLPVQVLEVSPRGHFWQLVVQPAGWQSEPSRWCSTVIRPRHCAASACLSGCNRPGSIRAPRHCGQLPLRTAPDIFFFTQGGTMSRPF